MEQPFVPDVVRVGPDPIDPGAVVARVVDPAAGATTLFLGTVRDHAPGKTAVTHLEYEAYSGVVEAKIDEIVAEARDHWDLCRVTVEHRTGTVVVGEPSVAVAVSSAHRAEAFAAARYVIDELKHRVPLWKKEHWPGGAEWVREDLERAPDAGM